MASRRSNAQYVVTAANPGWAPFVAANPGIFPAGATAALLIANRPFALGGNPLFGYDSSEGPRNYDGYRVSAGLNGDITDSLSWDIAATYMEQNASREGRDTVVNRYQLALLGFGGPNCNVTGNTPGANGCSYYNPFSTAIPGNPLTGVANPQFAAGASNDNPDLLNWMFPIVSTDQQTTLMVFDAVLSGRTGIDLPGGSIGWAAGLQYREDNFEARYSDLNNFAVTPCVNSVRTNIVGPAGCTPAQLAAPTGALLFLGGAADRDLDRDVSAVFGELSLPITDSFQAQLAARYEDYGSGIGSTFDPKLSLRWQLADAFALRGSVGTTFRGPALSQTDTSSVTTLQNVAGTFRAIRTFGDADLKPESALTFNVGMLLKAGGFNASVDYWSFDFEDQIVNEPVAGISSFVFGTGAACIDPDGAGPLTGLDNALRTRFAFTDTNGNNVTDLAECATGNIQRLDINVINGPDVKTDGIDVSAQFGWDMAGGTATLGLNATYVLKYDIDAPFVDGQQVSPAFDAAGKLNYQTVAYPLPKLKGNVFAEYANGPHNIRYVMNYIDDYEDQRQDIIAPSFANTLTRGPRPDPDRHDDRQHRVPRCDLPAATAVGDDPEPVGGQFYRRGSVVRAAGPVLRSVHFERARAHLQTGIAQALQCGVKGKRQGDVDRSGAAFEPPLFFAALALARLPGQRPALFPRRFRPERRRQKVDESPHLRHQIAALRIDGVHGQLLRLEFAEHRLESPAAQLVPEIKRRQLHDAAAGQCERRDSPAHCSNGPRR